ncbi:hypothetical protein GUITHDRAFT_150500, partial [Guillardia theta CCMP2712]|mmetsp:Transcript_51016/g.159413  ORF Transcript_51016/g.159413 Transcript_51016/m.159413 type:complete len:142 (-) Transcript_51016:139-564(-)
MAITDFDELLRCSSAEHSPLKQFSSMKRSSSEGDLCKKPRSLSGSEGSVELLDEMFQLEESEDQFIDEVAAYNAPLDLSELLDSLNTPKRCLGKRRFIESCPTNEGDWIEREFFNVDCRIRQKYNRIIGKEIMKAMKRRKF